MKKILLTALVALIGIFILSASIVWAGTVQLPKTGQTTSFRVGDDGDLQKGVAIPSPRFTDWGNGTVTDNLTGLMWPKNANHGQMTWDAAIDYANNLSLGGEGCGTDYTDWRLPNRSELSSIVDVSNYSLALPSSHPFTGVLSKYYWSSTTYAVNTDTAWLVNMGYGFVYWDFKASDYFYVWPVRSAD